VDVGSDRGTLTKLAHVRAGQSVCVVDVADDTRKGILKLMAMGLLPGAKLELLRSSPSVVYQTGFSQFAIDRELARQVIVEVLGNEEAANGC
jgi:Fe2+ transport system protein FeoA